MPKLTPLEAWRRSPAKRAIVKRVIMTQIGQANVPYATRAERERAAALALLYAVIRQLEEVDE